MKIKIVITLMEMSDYGLNDIIMRHAEVFNGELEIAPKGEYLTKISMLAEGMEHPICEVPFSPTVGYWEWHPPMSDDSQEMESREIRIITMQEESERESRTDS